MIPFEPDESLQNVCVFLVSSKFLLNFILICDQSGFCRLDLLVTIFLPRSFTTYNIVIQIQKDNKLLEAKLFFLHLMSDLVSFECWYWVSQERCSPCITDLGRLELKFKKYDSWVFWAAQGLDPAILEVTARGTTLDRCFIVLVFYIALSYQ